MSINIHLRAIVDAKLPNGNTKTLSERYDLYQTPTNVSFQIESSSDPLSAYLSWLRKVVIPYESDVYSDDDVWHEKPPIGKKLVDDYDSISGELKEWIHSHELDGYRIEWYSM